MSEQENVTAGQIVALDNSAEEQIRRVWHDGRWWYSVIDVIALLTGNQRPRKYWGDLKAKLRNEGYDEVTEKIRQLKMEVADGKQRLTDAADTETLLRIIQSVPSPKAEPFKRWLAQVGTERLAANRMRRLYWARGYTDDWIDRRLQGIVIRVTLCNSA